MEKVNLKLPKKYKIVVTATSFIDEREFAMKYAEVFIALFDALDSKIDDFSEIVDTFKASGKIYMPKCYIRSIAEKKRESIDELLEFTRIPFKSSLVAEA